MEKDIDDLTRQFSSLNIDDKVTKIQAWFRGNIFRLKRLPLSLYYIQQYLKNVNYCCVSQISDGRTNSAIDENNIINLLKTKFGNRIVKSPDRMWHDIIVKDYLYGWIPINIKTTTTITSDNTGNLAMCVYAYTNESLDINKKYDNGNMSKVLFEKIKNNSLNTIHKKDYYFLVVNKTNSEDIIINSLKGLLLLTPNINNLPFQVCWGKNRNFKYNKISNVVKKFVECLKNSKPSWQETFMKNIRAF